MPLITGEAIARMVAVHEEAGAAATLASMELEDPAGYGRRARRHRRRASASWRPSSPGTRPTPSYSIREVNAGLYVFAGGALLDALGRLRADNAQGEVVYLPDVLPLLLAAGEAVQAHPLADPGPRARRQRPRRHRRRHRLAQARIHREHQRAGVTIVDPGSTLIDAGVAIGAKPSAASCAARRGSASAP